MQKLIINPIYDGPILNLDTEELENLLSIYKHSQVNLDEESLGGLLENIMISLGDFIIRIKNNIKNSLENIFKDIKRSVLTITLQNNSLALNRLFSTDYTVLNNTVIPSYPFTIKPEKIATYFNDTFVLFDMTKRIDSLIDNYMKIASYIAVSDFNNVHVCIKNISILNGVKNADIPSHLLEYVSTSTSKIYFGTIFDATTELKNTIDLTMTSASELEKAIAVGKKLPNLYNAFDKIHNSIIKLKNNNVDIAQLSGLSSIMTDTGTTIEHYAMCVKEYHHLEYWLSLIIDILLPVAKK